MCPTSNAPSKTQDQKQDSCCGPSPDASKSAATEIRKTASADTQNTSAKETATDGSRSCCGGQGSK